MLMAVDPSGRIFYDNAGSHTASHGITNQGGTADGLIASLDFLSDSGLIRAITTTGVTITTPQSLDDRFMTRNEINALIAPIQALAAVLSLQISSVQASLPKVRLNPGENPVPFKIISFDSGSMAEVYDTPSQHVHVWASATSPPIDSPT